MEIEEKEVSLVKAQATRALTAAEAINITSAESLESAVDLLSKMKKVGRMIKDRKEAITKPLSEALNSARDLFKPIEANLTEAEGVVKRKMLDYQEAEEKRIDAEKEKVVDKMEDGKMSLEKGLAKMEKIGDVQTSAQGKIGSIATRIVKKYRVTDESKLSREYLMPDMGKITEALKAGKEVPGAEVYEEKVIAAR